MEDRRRVHIPESVCPHYIPNQPPFHLKRTYDETRKGGETSDILSQTPRCSVVEPLQINEFISYESTTLQCVAYRFAPEKFHRAFDVTWWSLSRGNLFQI